MPIGSCDFGPGGVNRTYSFAEEAGDTHLHHFDDSMQHDVDNGIIPMIHAAMAELERWTADSLSLVASPWSPPAWMKLPVGGVQSMIRTAQPNGLDPAMQRPYAHYFSRFLSGYAARGIDVWGVTIQNEAEAMDVGWEKCVYTADYMASFVKEHLGPVLREEHPRVKIIGFDHNKDHVLTYARGLYADPAAAHYFDGIGMHWYGGLNTDNLDGTHALAPDKFLLATEACNCPGVIYEAEAAAEWWQRAEHLGMDILQDLLHWSVGWIDWNLILDTTGGPNHLGNRCDANLIADPHEKKKTGDSVVVQAFALAARCSLSLPSPHTSPRASRPSPPQASYHYMGHFSRYLPRGSVRIGVNDTVEQEKPPGKGDLKNSQPMVFTRAAPRAKPPPPPPPPPPLTPPAASRPCEGSPLQSFSLDSGGMLTVAGTHFCLDVSAYGKGPRVDVYSCAHSPNQKWERRDAPSCPAGGQGTPACSLLVSPSTDKCLTRAASAPPPRRPSDPATPSPHRHTEPTPPPRAPAPPRTGDDQRGGDRPRCGKQVHRGAGAALHRWRRPLADILAQVRRRGRLPSLLPHPLATHARRQRRRRARAVRRPVHREGAGVRLARLCDARRRRERRRDEPRRQAAHLLAHRRRGRLGRRAADRPSALHLLPRPAAARRGDVRRARAKPWADGGAARLARSGERGGGRGGAGRDGHSRRARHRSCCARRLRRVRSPPPPPPRPRRPPGGPAGGGQADG